mgnify:FL=1
MITEKPWGNYQVLYDGEDCKVKRITVRPTHRLSLQSHKHRQEDWHIVAGTGLMELGHQVQSVYVGSKLFIPREAKHRIENTGTTDLVFIEIQTGTYFGEDDIVRYEDDYNRSKEKK